MCGISWFLVAAIVSSASCADAAEPVVPGNWPGTRSSLESLTDSTASVIAGIARGKADVLTRSAAHLSTSMSVGKGEVIKGGGVVIFAHCRQKFQALDVLHGKGKAGDRTLEYEFLEKARGFPLPAPAQAIPDGAKAILLLNEKGGLLKALPDTPENRKAVRDALTRKGDAKK
jgi:hypothetical protein